MADGDGDPGDSAQRHAQQPEDQAARNGGDPDLIAQPDVEIGASVRARRLRFGDRPRSRVELRGELTERGRRRDGDTESGSERVNLPDEVEPGVDYRDIRVRWRATARFVDVNDAA